MTMSVSCTERQKQGALVRQLEEELRLAHMRNPDQEIQQHIDALYSEKEHMSKEIYLLRETIKVRTLPFVSRVKRGNRVLILFFFLLLFFLSDDPLSVCLSCC